MKRKVLVLEDEENIRSFVVLNLKRAGYEIVQAGTGEEALAKYDENPDIRRVVDTLIDGSLSDGGTGVFRELYNSLLYGASWHRADNYFVLLDLPPYIEAKLRANRDYQDKCSFARKSLINAASAGRFSSDRTVAEYARDIWHIESIKGK